MRVDGSFEEEDLELARALRATSELWRPRRGPDWAELMARAEGERLQRYVLTFAAAAAAVVVAAGLTGVAALQQSGPAIAFLKQLISR